MALRIVEFYAQRGSVWVRTQKNREADTPILVGGVGQSTRAPGPVDIEEERAGSISPLEATALGRAGSGSIALLKTGELGDEERVVGAKKPRTSKVTSSPHTLNAAGAESKWKESDKVCSLSNFETMLTVFRKIIPLVMLVVKSIIGALVVPERVVARALHYIANVRSPPERPEMMVSCP